MIRSQIYLKKCKLYQSLLRCELTKSLKSCRAYKSRQGIILNCGGSYLIMNHELSKYIKEISENTDRIFYFVNSENLQLKKEAQDRVAAIFADELGLRLYGMRSGPEIQDPKTLLDELKELRIEKFDIICIKRPTRESILLSHKNKEQFVKYLEKEDVNTGIIAESLITEEET